MIRFVLRAGIVAFALGAAAVTAVTLPSAVSVDRERDLLVRLAGLDAVDIGLVEAAHDELMARTRQPAACAPEGAAPAAAISARLADHYIATLRHDLIDAAVAQALADARAAIACEPYEALGWLSLARFTLVTEGFSPGLMETLRFTYRIAPAQGWVRALRATFLVDLRRFLEPEDEERLLGDLVALVDGEVPRLAAQLASRTSTDFQQRLGSRVGALSFVRQRQYQTEALALQVDVSRLTIPASSRDNFRFDMR
jgi:hypothetical protein